MESIALTTLQTLLIATLCLMAGAALTRRVGVLARYNIPEPVTGGLLFAIVISTIGFLPIGAPKLALEVSIKPTLLLMFFAGMGMSADLRQLKQGGKALLVLMVLLFPFIVLQNLTGIVMALLLDLHPIYGVIAGSITLVGGHGTGAAYAERFAEINNLQLVMDLSMTSATLGLILGGIVAGPVASWLLKRHRLKGTGVDTGRDAGERDPPVSASGVAVALAGIFGAVVIGQWLGTVFKDLPLTIPGFLWCMLSGVAIRNLAPFVGIRLDDRASDLVATLCLSLFIVMTMMALNLVDVFSTAGPLILILAAQVVVIALFAAFVCFRFMGRDYEAAVTSAAFIGFNLGSTATAIANMQAITSKFGPAPQSFLIVPLAGAFLVDLMNAVILTGFLSTRLLGG